MSQSADEAVFSRACELVNHVGTHFSVGIERTIRLLPADVIDHITGNPLPAGVRAVAYHSDNRLTNTGDDTWTAQGGMLSIWLLGMYKPSPATTVVIPIKVGPTDARGPRVNDAYFGEVPAAYLRVEDDVVFFKGDGTRRGKIGISPQRSKGLVGSYDAAGHVLTLIDYNVPEQYFGYVNSMWELQKEPFRGDVINAYNDGSPARAAAPRSVLRTRNLFPRCSPQDGRNATPPPTHGSSGRSRRSTGCHCTSDAGRQFGNDQTGAAMMPSCPRRFVAVVPFVLISATMAWATARPNFLFIITDDQSPYTLCAYGNTVCHTPNIDRIANQGMVIYDAHHMGSWSGAVCRPSRTMIMTGQSLWRIPGAPRADSAEAAHARTLEAARHSMPALFNAAGYVTFRTCKQSNSFPPANRLFDVLHEADKRGSSPEDGSAWHGDRAIDFLEQREATRDTTPFLMFLGFSHPHDPRNGTPELLAEYGAVNTATPPTSLRPGLPGLPINYLPAHPFHHGHPGLRDETKVSGVLTDRSEATIRNELGREYACIENIDRQIGQVLDQLQATGELDNTFVFFTSDHGIAVGRHGLVGKQNLYEHTWCVPLLIRGPGIRPGSHASGYVYLMDILPTLCDLADIEIPETLEGLSFRPVLEGTRQRTRDVLYGAYCGGTKPGMRCVKSQQWKLIKYDVMDGAVRETQLFDLKNNPYELLQEHHMPDVIALTGNAPDPQQRNLADDPRYAQQRQELEALLLSEQQHWNDPYRLWDQTPLP